jgi:glutaredoxin-related protein
MRTLDTLRARAKQLIDNTPGRLGELARKTNDALGRPLADADELVDRRRFMTRSTTSEPAAAKPAAVSTQVAPVIVYCMDKTRRDASKLTDMLDAEKVVYSVSNIQEDPAAQMAVRRDSKGYRLPVVFIAGEAIGGRAELSNLISTGDLKNKLAGK